MNCVSLVLGVFLCLTSEAVFVPATAIAQNITCPTRAVGDSSNACASTAFVDTQILADFASPPPLGNITPNTVQAITPLNTDNSTNVATTAFLRNINFTRTLQSFGAVGDGVTDDTTAVSNALNSGVPLSCGGKFVINSLVTMTNVNVSMFGGGGPGCTLILNSTQSMLYATLTGASNYTSNTFKFHDVKISVNAVITSVTGPAKTAALYITYPLGTMGDNLPLVDLFNVSVKPTSTSNYTLNGIYLNDATNVWIQNFMYEGKVTAVDANSSAIVYDGTHSPTNLHIIDSYADLVGTGILTPFQSANGWQGIRVKGFDCVFCKDIVFLMGAGDGLSDYVDLTGVEGAFNNAGITITNVTHSSIHNNYMFMSNVAGLTSPAFPTCFTDTWSIAIPSNGENSNISDNKCDGIQITGTTTKYGFNLGGEPNTNSHLGVNELSNLDTGISTAANTTGWALEKQRLRSVTTEWTANETAGSEFLYQPFAVTDASAQHAGYVGEVINSAIQSTSPVSLSTGAAKDVTTISLTAGHWSCYGNIGYMPGATTTITLLEGGISQSANTMPATQPWSLFFDSQTFTTGTGDVFPLNTYTVDISTTTVLHLVALSNFAASTQAAYGFIECQRTR